ncbi:MAG: hypothetical protein Q7T82_06535 [Armatimonadota bacterium]|nr:hypothetical protein [Armatimonadota bacterium]
MEINPVQAYGNPLYPTRTIMDEHPELLLLVPKRWRGNPVVIAALTGVCLLVSGCRSGNKSTGVVSRIAPIFAHGAGRGSFGCRVMNPPVFLSEDEARQVVIQEAKKAGISFRRGGHSLSSVSVPVTDPWSGRGRRAGIWSILPARKWRWSKLDLDGTDRKRKISFEYVSSSDFDGWRNAHITGPSVYTYDLVGTARMLRKGLSHAGPPGNYGVFYDPVRQPKGPPRSVANYQAYQKDRGLREADARKAAKDDLRKQVRGFIKWLKAQGVV